MRLLPIALVMAGCLGAQDMDFAFGFQRRDASDTRRRYEAEREYDRGQRALDGRRYKEAVEAFAKAAAEGAPRADGALYWKAWALHRQAQTPESLAALDALFKRYPSSRWTDDAKALELELRQASGQKINPEGESDEDIKLMAINSLIRTDPERALPLLEKLLKGTHSPKLKERALFVLANADSPRAREVLAQAARGGANPDLQLKAIGYLAVMGGNKEERLRILTDVYGATSDFSVKRAVMRGFMAGRATDRLAHVARTESVLELRKEAIQLLGAARGQAELRHLYSTEASGEIRAAAMKALFTAQDTDAIIRAAQSDKDPQVRREAVRLLGVMGGQETANALVALYANEKDPDTRKAILDGLFMKRDAKALVDLARKETDPQLRKLIVERLSMMKSKEATDYMLEILNK